MKILLNSAISDAQKGVRFISADIKDYFLATLMKEQEYIKVKYCYFPSNMHLKYNLDALVTKDGCIYI